MKPSRRRWFGKWVRSPWLCHAYGEYKGMDCLQKRGHAGNHGDIIPRGNHV